MGMYPGSAVERAMKVQEVILRAMSGQLQWYEAAEILGVSCRTMRRWKRRYESGGYDGLFDRRRQQPSPKRVPMKTVQKVLRLYRKEYQDFNVRHFHEHLQRDHGIDLSYTWVKTALQETGLVAKKPKRGPHRQRRPRRPMIGMMLHCDGSTHEWLRRRPGQRQDLIILMDDANSEVYSAYLVEEEGTLTVMQGLKEVLEAHGTFCSLYTDRGSHFFNTPKGGGPVDKSRPTQIGRALQQLGIDHIPSYSPQARGRMERMFETWQGRLPQELRRAGIKDMAAANEYIRKRFLPRLNERCMVDPQESGSAFVPCGPADLDGILSQQVERTVGHDNTVSYGRRRLQLPPSKFRWSFAKCRVRVCEHIEGSISVRYGPRVLGWYCAEGKLLPRATESRLAA